MVVCPRCGTENPPGSVFCNRCGTRLSVDIQKASNDKIISLVKKYSIFIGALAIIIIIGLFNHPGEQDLCAGVYCEDECRGTELWKTRCVEGECVPDYPLEKNSPACGYSSPSSPPSLPPDYDGDGVPDHLDECTNVGCTQVDNRGCPLDSDGDGVQDCYDQCPDESGERRNKGCPVPMSDSSKIEISSVNYNPPGNDNDNPNGEWVKIINTGTADIDMSGWNLYDQAYLWGTARDHVLVFPQGFILQAGQSVTVYTGKGINSKTALYFGRSPGEYAAIWNNDGDCAYLEDNTGKLIDTYCW